MDFWISVWISADGVRDFFRDGTPRNSMAAVFIDPRSLALGAEYKILQFLVVERTLLTLCSTV